MGTETPKTDLEQHLADRRVPPSPEGMRDRILGALQATREDVPSDSRTDEIPPAVEQAPEFSWWRLAATILIAAHLLLLAQLDVLDATPLGSCDTGHSSVALTSVPTPGLSAGSHEINHILARKEE